MRLHYVLSDYVSHLKTGLAYRGLLERLGVELVDDAAAADAIVLHDEPPTYPLHLARLGAAARGKPVVAYAVWETDVLPTVYREALGGVLEVWTASRHAERAMRAAGLERVFVVPHLVQPPETQHDVLASMLQRISHEPRCFYFFTICDAGNPRKNVAALLAAFERLRVRLGDGAVRLVIKQYARIDRTVAERAGVVSIEEPLAADEIDALHVLADGYVSCHRAEAWGLGLSEAMAAGKPVVATGWGGNTDYMSEADAYPVRFALRRLTPDEVAFAPTLLTPAMRWAEIDPAALDAALETVVARRGSDPRAARASTIVERYGPAALAPILAARLEALSPRHAGPRARPRAERALPEPGAVCMFHELSDPKGIVVGRDVAVSGLVDALARHGSERYALFVPGRHRDDVAQIVAGSRATAHDARDLGAHLDACAPLAWHEPQAEPERPFALRDRAARPYPVTMLHHTLSYKELLHQVWLALLCARPRPFDAVVCSSEAARRALAELLGHVRERFAAATGARLDWVARLEIVPLGVDLDRFRPRDRTAARAATGLPEGAFVLLWVGRLSAVDKADLVPLVTSFAELVRSEAPDRPRILVCAGSERPAERLGGALTDLGRTLGLGERLRIVTEVASSTLAELYAAADVFVSPVDNVQESFGIAPVEAMASGLPQIVADWNGYRDTVVHGETGWLVPTIWTRPDDLSAIAHVTDSPFDHLALAQSVAIDPRALRDAVERLAADPSLCAAMATASRRRAEERFGWPVVVRRLEALWRELAAEAARAAPRPPPPSHAAPDYARAFAHYATRLLGDTDALRLTEAGRALARGERPLPSHHNERWGHLDLDLISRVLAGLARSAERGEALAVGRVVAVIERSSPGSRGAVLRHLLWLVKYDLAELERG
jgi:glycosyltransferase involved in cell wall biosynthesis